MRRGDFLEPIAQMERWVSPFLGIRFERGAGSDPGVYDSEGNRFRYVVEIRCALLQTIERERARAEDERNRAEKLAQKLRAMGVDPNTL